MKIPAEYACETMQSNIVRTQQLLTEIGELMHRVDPNEKVNGRRILLCEDNPGDAFFMERALHPLSREIVHCKDGKTCLEIVEKNDIGAIVLDINLPDMNALEIMAMMKHPKSKTVIVTGLDAELIEDYRKRLPVPVFGKPVDPAEIRAAVLRVLEG